MTDTTYYYDLSGLSYSTCINREEYLAFTFCRKSYVHAVLAPEIVSVLRIDPITPGPSRNVEVTILRCTFSARDVNKVHSKDRWSSNSHIKPFVLVCGK